MWAPLAIAPPSSCVRRPCSPSTRLGLATLPTSMTSLPSLLFLCQLLTDGSRFLTSHYLAPLSLPWPSTPASRNDSLKIPYFPFQSVVVVFLPVSGQGEGVGGRERGVGDGVSMAADDASGVCTRGAPAHRSSCSGGGGGMRR
jgi:hypothetical protein